MDFGGFIELSALQNPICMITMMKIENSALSVKSDNALMRRFAVEKEDMFTLQSWLRFNFLELGIGSKEKSEMIRSIAMDITDQFV